MQRNFSAIIVFVLAALLLLPLSSYAQTDPSEPPWAPGPQELPDPAGATEFDAPGFDVSLIPPDDIIYETVSGPQKYYVDATNGNDNNPGTEANPWKTLQKVYEKSSEFSPGDYILLKRGETWNEQLRLQCDGDPTKSNKYITISDYYNGEKPIINGDGFNYGIYLDRNFIYLRNLFITYKNNGFNNGGTVGKGIGIFRSANPDLEVIDSNIVIDQCDVSNCPLDGILIVQRGHIVISGDKNNDPPPFPDPNPSINKTIAPILYLLLNSSDLAATSLEGGMLMESTGDPISLDPPLADPPEGFAYGPLGDLIPLPPPLLPPPFSSSGSSSSIPSDIPPDLSDIPPDIPDIPPDPSDISGSGNSATTMGVSVDDCNSQISSNGGPGITVLSKYNNTIVDCSDITINYCEIDGNNHHGIYLEGSNAIINNNVIYNNAHSLAPGPYGKFYATHNIYLWGNDAKVYNNTIKLSGKGGNGCGFRYSGSGLRFGLDPNNVPSPNDVKDNYNAGIGLQSNDFINNCDNNRIAHNSFHVIKTDVGGNNMAISIGYDNEHTIFTNTYIHDNTITGDNDTNKKAGGIDVQPCQNLSIHNNTFSADLISERLTGPLLQIDRYGYDPDGNLWEWTLPDLNSDFSHHNTFYVNSPGLSTANLWFYDERFNDNPGWCSWDHWTLLSSQGGLGRDRDYTLMQGQTQ
jgi:hypothetical protein